MLFLPQHGASLHHLKIEIGGDSQSTDGTEASHMHERDDLHCGRGYEFWLLEEARRRNPEIVTYALSWAAPAWVGNDSYFGGTDNIDYHIKWLECVRRDHSTVGDIDYMGVWNEKPWGTPNWVKELHAAMEAAGFKTQLVLGDGLRMDDGILTDFEEDPTFEAAVAGIGLHYPCFPRGNGNMYVILCDMWW